MVNVNRILRSLHRSMLFIDSAKVWLAKLFKITKDFVKSFVVSVKKFFSTTKSLFSKMKDCFLNGFFSKSGSRGTTSIFDSTLTGTSLKNTQSQVVDESLRTDKLNIAKIWNKNKENLNKNSSLLEKNKNLNRKKYIDLLKLRKSSFLRADIDFNESSIEKARTF